ncbi:SGNH/GDSL hydrolase family protein [Streptomyces blastmyceticus]|uniref:SGNH/GDSL hydrolase family protein n=1 Tax=Streptomyces blastmyceticus TaxID=68180 RepID=A0ABN0WWI5_9ACTN
MPRAASQALAHHTDRKTRTPRGAARAGGAILAAALAFTAFGGPGTARAAEGGSGAYVALGDSYAAGAGVPDQSGGLCMRSSKNYGHLVAAAVGPSAYRDVTCAGAKVAALTTTHTDAGIPVNGPQLDAISADTDLVTLTIGGNDIGTSDLGFVDVVAVCSALSLTNPLGAPCRDSYNAGGRDILEQRLDAAAVRLGDGIRRIRSEAPNAKVLLVGYPTVIDSDPVKCLGKLTVTLKDTAYLHSILAYLQALLARTAAANEATFVDTTAVTEGHDACSADPWVEGLLPKSPALPLHPNARGERVMADAVLRAIGR